MKKAPWFDDQVKEVPRVGRKRHLRDKDLEPPEDDDETSRDIDAMLRDVEQGEE